MNVAQFSRPPDGTKNLPINVDMEQSILGAFLINNDAIHLVSDFLHPHHFYEPVHQRIYELTRDMVVGGKRVTPISLKTYLPDSDASGQFNLHEYLAKLVSEATTIVNVPDWGQEIAVLWGRRAAIGAGEQLAIDARDTSRLLSHSFADHSKAMIDIEGELIDEDEVLTLAQGMTRQVTSIADAYQNDKTAGLDTKVPAIDRLTGPWHPGQLIIIGGSTKMGKTSLAMQAIMGIAEQDPVLMFSYEMKASELAARELSRKVGVSTYRQSLGNVSDSEFEKLQANANQSKAYDNLVIVGQAMTLEQMEKVIIREKKRSNIKAVAVDHIGLIEPDKSQRGMSNWELGEIATRKLKRMATKHDVVMIGLCQLKKNAAHQGYNSNFATRLKSAFNRPKYSDLIGGVERDAHHVIIPFRSEALLEEMEPMKGTDDHGKWEAAISNERGKAKIILALSRERKWPKVEGCLWDGPRTEFKEDVQEERFL